MAQDTRASVPEEYAMFRTLTIKTDRAELAFLVLSLQDFFPFSLKFKILC